MRKHVWQILDRDTSTRAHARTRTHALAHSQARTHTHHTNATAHLHTHRYLEKEFSGADFSAAGGFQLERVIDDFVLMVAFVGNDFLPHLPSLEIREGAIDTILDIYKTSITELGGYMTSNGEVCINVLSCCFVLFFDPEMFFFSR